MTPPTAAPSDLSAGSFSLLHHEIEQNGFGLVRNVMNAGECLTLLEILGSVSGAGNRGLLGRPEVTALAHSDRLLNLIRPHLPAEPQPVRAIYFDKSAEANWGVPWHQDLTIALRARAEAAGFGPWSTKEGIPHVQPPAELLARMLTLRLHLDNTDESNGSLRVLPGSHRQGRLTSARIQELRAQQPDFLCAAATGDALLMRPLLLHASGRSTSPRHRRILHLEYAGFTLPEGLEWHEAA